MDEPGIDGILESVGQSTAEPVMGKEAQMDMAGTDQNKMRHQLQYIRL